MLSPTSSWQTARVWSVALVALALLPVPAWCHFNDLCPDLDHCTSDAQCNDGDPCTLDFCDPIPDGVDGCCDHNAIVPCIDTFLCYDVAPSKNATRFATIPDVRVADLFEDLLFDVTELRALCTPADRDGAGVHDRASHLDRYRIVPAAKPALRVMAKGVKAETAIGAVLVDVVAGDGLFVPAAKGLSGPPQGLEGSRVDDLKCYDVKPSRGAPKFPKGVRITLADQFTRAPKPFAVTGPVHLCTAGDTNGEGFEDSCSALLCYGVKADGKQTKFSRVKGIWARDRFGLQQVDAVKEDEACLPAVVNDRTCLAQGFACEADADCSTGHCVDGVCCESACGRACYACNGALTGAPHGVCAPIESVGATDTVPVTLCSGTTGCADGNCTCDGLGRCTGPR